MVSGREKKAGALRRNTAGMNSNFESASDLREFKIAPLPSLHFSDSTGDTVITATG